MIFANYLKYGDRKLILELRPAHQKYIFELMDMGKVVAAGSFPDDAGGLYLYRTESQEAANKLMADDPYFTGNAIAEYRITFWEIHGANPALLQVTKKAGS